MGARLGFELPIGSAYSGTDLSSLIVNMVPIWFDAGVAVNDIYVGAYLQ